MRVLSYWLVSILLFSFLTAASFSTSAATSRPRYISSYQAGASYTSGTIIQNTSWTLSASPYLITDDVFVYADVFLTIEPGVTAEFAGGKNLVIDGCLIAQGNLSDPITFTSNSSSPTAGDWGTINMRSHSTATNILEYARVSYSTTGLTLSADCNISNCVFEYNTNGISMGGNTYVRYSRVVNNTGTGIGGGGGEIENSEISMNGVGVAAGIADIKNCVVVGNSGTGIGVDTGEIINCTIQANGNGIAPFYEGGDLSIVGSNVSNNNGDGVTVIGSASVENCLLTNDTNGVSLGGYSSYCNVVNSTISRNRGDGVYGLVKYPGCTLDHTNVTDNQGDGVYLQAYGGSGCYAYSSNIANNVNGMVIMGWGEGAIVQDSSIQNNTNSGVTLEGWINTLQLTNSLIENSIYGIYGAGGIWASDSVIQNTTYAIWKGGPCVLERCEIHDGQVGITAIESEIPSTVHSCDMYNFSQYSLVNQGANEIDATNNWWGTNNESQIDALIYDYYDNFNVGTVLYKPYLTAPFESYPVASFVYEPSEPVVNENVTFDASASYDPDGSIYSFFWDFGDGTNSTKITPLVTHSYTRPDTYNVTLIVTDNEGLNDTATKPVSVGKQSSTISISASPMTITIGENTTIRGTLTPTLHGANATIWYRFSGEQTWDVLTNVTTGESGQYTYTWVPSEPGFYELETSWTGDENTLPAESSLLTLNCMKIASSISLSASPTTIKIGENMTITGSIIPTRKGINVTIWCGPGEHSFDILINTTTGENSEFSYAWTPSDPGTYALIASWAGDEYTAPAESSPVTVNCMKIFTSISISTDCSSAIVGFRVNVTGTLADEYGNGLSNENVVLYYTFGGIGTWTPITSDTTDNNGNYFATWIPTATGYFVLKAEWAGNATHSEMSNRTTLSSLPYNDQYVFSVESNSTISELTFNTTDRTLGFTATGPNDTEGYVKVTVAKSLIENATNVRVYLDGNESEYAIASTEDSWLLAFNYTHSTHQIAIDLDVTVIPEFPSTTILLSFLMLLLLVIIARRKFTKRAA